MKKVLVAALCAAALAACIGSSLVVGDLIGFATNDPLFPACRAFSGRCDPDLVRDFQIAATIWILLLGATLAGVYKFPFSRYWR